MYFSDTLQSIMPPKTPKLETFEQNIVEEIKRKDEAINQNKVPTHLAGDQIVLPKKPPTLLIALIATSSLCVIGLLALIYFYFTDPLLPPSASPIEVSSDQVPKITTELTKLSPILSNEIGRFVTSVEKKGTGYVLTLNTYSPVFAYMTRNENMYSKELLRTFYPSFDTATITSTTTVSNVATSTTTTPSATTTPSPAISTTTVKTSTSTTGKPQGTEAKTSTAKNPPTKTGTSTLPVAKIATSSTEEPITISSTTLSSIASSEKPNSYFTDITLENQNMRVYTYQGYQVVYAFVGDTKLLIANSPEGILALKK